MKIPEKLIEKLKKEALETRRLFLEIACKSRALHIGSSLSEIDLLVALYFNILKINPKSPKDAKRDRFILSKGHAALGLYIVLARRGFITLKELNNYGKDNTKLTAHPVLGSACGIEATTGSLGHGLPMGLGMALAAKRTKERWRVFVLMSDGECDEGSNWEAILLAGHLKLNNIVAIIDYNKIQSFGRVKDVLDLEPFAKKWQAAKWEVKEINGHDFKEILGAFNKLPLKKNRPTAIIAHTVKGRGVPYMENKLEWHYLNIKPENLEKTLKSIY